MSTWQADRGRNARRNTAAALVEAQTRADETQQVLDYMVKDIIGAMAPGSDRKQASDRDPKCLASRRHDCRAGSRAGRASSPRRLVMADMHLALGHSEEAGPWLPAPSSPFERLGPEHPDSLTARAFQARVYRDGAWKLPASGARVEAVALEVLAARRRVLGPAHPDTIRSIILGQRRSRPDRLDQARRLAEQAVRLGDHHLGPNHP